MLEIQDTVYNHLWVFVDPRPIWSIASSFHFRFRDGRATSPGGIATLILNEAVDDGQRSVLDISVARWISMLKLR